MLLNHTTTRSTVPGETTHSKLITDENKKSMLDIVMEENNEIDNK